MARRWSLVGRLTGGVALIAVLAFLSQALVLDAWLHPLVGELASVTAAHAQTLRAALAAVPITQRPALARRLSNDRVRISTDPPTDDDGRGGPPLEFAELLQARAGPQFIVRRDLRPASGMGVVLGTPLDEQSWWFSFEASVPPPAVQGTVLFWLAALTALTLAALLLSVRFIARPIGRLAAQIGSQRGRLQAIPEDPRASDEMHALVRAFNGLVEAVETGHSTRQQLLAGVSHDLRTPLARLRLRAETQCEPAVGDAMAVDLGSLERIVDQFMAYVQGDSGRLVGREAPLAATVAEVVRRRADQGQPLSARLDDQVRLNLPDLPVQRLLGNLIDNALAYGQPPVTVELAATAGGAALRVLDRGLGMSQAEFELAQQPFVRLSAARNDLGHCGLGLAIVAQIARQWGGTLRLAHQPGAFGIEVDLPRR
jgi:two-component system osmolarity sensor histidine kinase EnvZ